MRLLRAIRGNEAPIGAEELLDAMQTPLAVVNRQRVVVKANAALEEELCERRLVQQSAAALAFGAGQLLELIDRALEQRERISARRMLLEMKRGHPRRFDVQLMPLRSGDALIEFHLVAEADQDLGEGAMPAPDGAAQQMARALAHEIKNPLAGLHGAAQLLERELPNRALTEYTQVIRTEVDRIRRLVDRLALAPELVRGGESFNVHEVLERVRTLTEAEGGARVERDYDPSLPDIVGHADRLHQALLNLARNALQSGASDIRLRTRAEHRVRIGERIERLAIRIDVIDNGCGVPEDIRDHLFVPFVTGRNEGTGLGLPVTLAIAREHGGTLAFTSRPGATTFSLLLPVSA
jgi:two-component system nitrogen regulation sensor histidine kinase GlnL